MRTFIAIEVSEGMKKTLGQIEAHLKYSGADVKWVNPDIVHLTLKFLGEISDAKVEEVKVALDSIARTTKPFALTVKDIGAFPDMEHPRVIWVGLDQGANEIVSLASRVDEDLSKIGFTKESRPFRAHLTIGRVRSSLNKEKLKDKIKSAASNFSLSDMAPHQVSSVILFQSTLTPRGSIYTKLHDVKFSL